MSYSNQQDRNDYSIGASQSAQANFEQAAGRLEAALQRRDQDVRAPFDEGQHGFFELALGHAAMSHHNPRPGDEL